MTRVLAVYICLLAATHAEETTEKVVDWTTKGTHNCKIHGDKLTKVVVPIVWGLPARPERGYSMADRARLFPHSQTLAFGGCCVPADYKAKKRAYIHRCDTCVKEFHAWLAKNYPLPEQRRPVAPANHRSILRDLTKQKNAEQDSAPNPLPAE